MPTLIIGNNSIPYMPEKISINQKSNILKRNTVAGNEIIVSNTKSLISLSFSSFISNQYLHILENIQQIFDENKRTSIYITGIYPNISMDCVITKLDIYHTGGNIDCTDFFIEVIEFDESKVIQSTPQSIDKPRNIPPNPYKPNKYIVKRGDSLWAIAKQYLGDGARYMEIANLNNIKNPSLILVGQEVILP